MISFGTLQYINKMNERILTHIKQNMCFRITHYYSDYFVRIICIWNHNNSIPCSSGFKHELVGQGRTKPPFKLGNLFTKNTEDAATCSGPLHSHCQSGGRNGTARVRNRFQRRVDMTFPGAAKSGRNVESSYPVISKNFV